MATQRAWFRFVAQTSAIIGRVDVPQSPPEWFLGTLETLSKSAGRGLTMDDISTSDWLDYLISAGRMIPLRKPMMVRQVHDVTFIKREDMEKIQKMENIEQAGPAQIAEHISRIFTGSEIDEFIKKDETRAQALQENLVPFDMGILGRPQPMRQQIEPLISLNTDEPQSFRLGLNAFASYAELKDYDRFQQIAEGVYADQPGTSVLQLVK